MRQAQKAMEERVAMPEQPEMNTTARQLANIFIAATTMANGIGCYGLTATATLDMSAQDCDSNYCPDCFYFSGSGAITITINNCHTSKWTQGGLAMGSGDLGTAVRMYTFINLATDSSYRVTITDGTSDTYVLAARQSAVAFCHTGVSGKLHYPYNPMQDYSSELAGCPKACDEVTPKDPNGDDFTRVRHPSLPIYCSSSITNDGSSS